MQGSDSCDGLSLNEAEHHETTCAAFTIAQDVPRFLALGVGHCRQLVGPENVFALDLDHDHSGPDALAGACRSWRSGC